MVAYVLVLSAQQLSTVGLGQYLIAFPEAGPSEAFHTLIFHVGLGTLAFVGVWFFGEPLGAWLDAPEAHLFIPGLLLGALFDRIAYVPERVLVRDMRFPALSVGRTVADVAYSVGSVFLAVLGWGAMAIVVGNVLRGFFHLVMFAGATKGREWLWPHRLYWRQFVKLTAFGAPLSVAALATFAARRWDNVLVSKFFGPAAAGAYNLAYNLADVPRRQLHRRGADLRLHHGNGR
jgi:PST family polysaccharide transporter